MLRFLFIFLNFDFCYKGLIFYTELLLTGRGLSVRWVFFFKSLIVKVIFCVEAFNGLYLNIIIEN